MHKNKRTVYNRSFIFVHFGGLQPIIQHLRKLTKSAT